MIEEATKDNIASFTHLMLITDFITGEDDPVMIEALKILKEKHSLTKDDICVKSMLRTDPCDMSNTRKHKVTYIYRKRKPL